jgi:hypothetical protein
VKRQLCVVGLDHGREFEMLGANDRVIRAWSYVMVDRVSMVEVGGGKSPARVVKVAVGIKLIPETYSGSFANLQIPT